MTAGPPSSARLSGVIEAGGGPFGDGAGHDLPSVSVNMVMSVDGATTIAGRVGALTGSVDQVLLHRLRAEADAVLVGAQTVRAEGYGALLGTEDRQRRERERGSGEPLLCVVTGDPARLAGTPALDRSPSPLVFLTSAQGRLPPADRRVAAIRADRDRDPDPDPDRDRDTASPPAPLALRPLLRRLRAQFGVRKVVCEGGPTLNAALLAEDLVGDLFVSLSPLLAHQPVSPRIAAGDGAPMALQLVAHAAADGFVFLRYRRRG